MSSSKYNYPRLLLSKDELNQIKDIVRTTIGEVKIPLHHPYYRDIIRNYAQSLGKTAKSIVDYSLPMETDSILLVHISCRKANPVTKLQWFNEETYKYARCLYCNDGLHTDYEDDKTNSFGYFKVRGKNCLLIK